MARWRMILHNDGVRIYVGYGYSPLLGFFSYVVRGGVKVLDYDILDQVHYHGLPGMLDALVEVRVFTRETVEEALTALPFVDELEDIEDIDARRVAEIVFNVKHAAGE